MLHYDVLVGSGDYISEVGSLGMMSVGELEAYQATHTQEGEKVPHFVCNVR